MEAVLIDIVDVASVGVAREAVREHGAQVGLDELGREALASATSELAHNQLRHAVRGTIAIRAITRQGYPGVEVEAVDRGPGITDPGAAILGTGPGKGLGVGLSAAYRLADELDVDTRAGEGTRIRARKLTGAIQRREVAIVGRACPGEVVSGDHAGVFRDGDTIWLGVCDGLGHGSPARAASDAALATFQPGDPADLLARIDAALVGTRGAVMSIARIELAAGTIDHAGVGNISTRLYERGHARILRVVAGSLGAGARPRRIPEEQTPFAGDHVLVMASDGVVSRVELELPILRLPPLAIAHHILTTFARPTDDVIVAVLR